MFSEYSISKYSRIINSNIAEFPKSYISSSGYYEIIL